MGTKIKDSTKFQNLLGKSSKLPKFDLNKNVL